MKNKEQSEITRSILLKVAKKEFSLKGYSNVSLEEIAQQATLTRGSLYHHFKSKKGLFKAVVEELHRCVSREVEKAAIQHNDPWLSLIAGSMAFIRTMINEEYHRILILDAPTILGWGVWESIDDDNSEKYLKEHLLNMAGMGVLLNVSVDALSSILSGTMNEAVMWIGRLDDKETALREVSNILERMIYAFRKHD